MENFNNGWEFAFEGQDDWQAVDIPHDWLIKDTKNLYKDGVGCYRKKYFWEESLNGERVFLRFDGVYQDSYLYVNGVLCGEWKNGYTAFSHEITAFLKTGENEILMKVVYQSPNTRWYSGAGIYREVFLMRKNAVHFKQSGIYIKTQKIDGEKWRVEIEAEVESNGQKYEIKHSLPEIIENPRIWDIHNHELYELQSQLFVDGQLVDTAFTRFGFREIAFTADGFFLNGRRVQLNGVCHHHDLGALGAAVHKDAIKWQLFILRGMGVNAIRTAHNPPASAFMELCDEFGFLVMSEFTDVWKRSKTKYDYARFFDEWAARDVESWIKRDRNCPSIIMWSVGNEIYDTNLEEGKNTLEFLIKEVRRHDPKHNAEITLCSNYMPWENTQKCADIIKLMGYNYAEYLYGEHRAAHPDWIIYGSETAATVQSRGVYHFPLKKSLLSDDDLQCSALGNSATSWGAKSTEAVIADHLQTPGQFIWTGYDYIGEPTPYHTKNSYFGQIDTAGFQKDSYYIYRAAWSEMPTLHLYPYWDWSPGQPVDVRIASNAPVVELFLNGKSLGKRELGNSFTTNYIVPYQAGSITAYAYNKNGEEVSTMEHHSFGDAVSLKIYKRPLGELEFVIILAFDKKDYPVFNANNRVKVNVTGGKLLGLDNGDSTDYDQYQGVDNRRLFNGYMLAIVKPNHGEKTKITAEFDYSDIPIRKIELLRDGYEITAKIHPPNATYNDLQWRLSDAAGIDSPLGRLVVSDKTAVLHPKGDGEVYVRCATNNGGEHISLISVLPIEITGLGTPFLDPYSFISGGLYNIGNDTVTNGNERGIATARDRESVFGFTDLDFGTFGADEITLWLFPLSDEPFRFEIRRGGQHLYTADYDKGSIWNTYQPVTYKLPEKLRGIETLSFVFNQKVHVKGFQFKSKTYEQIPFAACDKVYGDSYEVKETAIEKIGNNVTISFNNMNFEEPAKKIELRWRSRLNENSIRLVFADDDGAEIINQLTLPASAEKYSNAVLDLENPLNGKGQVHFIFLPGSEIDLEVFKFFMYKRRKI